MEEPDDRPVFDPGEIIDSPTGDLSCKIIEHIGEGRCCMVYSARTLTDNTRVALKVYKRGPTYEGAVMREQYILELFSDPRHNIALMYGQFVFKGLHCQVMELLDCNIRSVIFRNDRQGLSPWATQKFAEDVLTSLASLHEHSFVHADIKPANIMWSSYDGCFKLLDFGLSFHTEEEDLHQIQSTGYKSPEAAEWNKFKDVAKKKRRLKLQGTYSDLTKAAPAYDAGLDGIGVQTAVVEPVKPVEPPVPEGTSRTVLRAPPRHRMSGASSASSDRASILVLDEYQRHHSSSSRRCSSNGSTTPTTALPSSVTMTTVITESTTVAAAAAAVAQACNKWLSESSGIYTASTQSKADSSVEVSTASRQHEKEFTLCQAEGQNSKLLSSGSSFNTSSSGQDSTSFYASTASSQDAEEDGQEWRRGRSSAKPRGSKRHPRPTSICAPPTERRPLLPNAAADMWSFGCLLVEVLTGTKLFSAADRMASVLKPLQLLEMRIGETEIRYDALGQQAFFSDAKDLIKRCLLEEPAERITAQEALNHAIFKKHSLLPSTKDMVTLPSHVLKLFNVLNSDKYKKAEEIEDGLRDIREAAEEYGRVTEVSSRDGHAYIEFQEASDSIQACSGLTGKTFDDKTVLAVFYPSVLWTKKCFV